MVIITAATGDYAPYVECFRKACAKVGHECHVYGLDKDAMEFADERLEMPPAVSTCWLYQPLQGSPSRGAFKPLLLLKALDRFNCPVVWMDADAFPVAPLTPHPWHDIAVTVRRPQERKRFEGEDREYSGYINAGVVFAANTDEAKRFLGEWLYLIPQNERRNDQLALARMLLKAYDFEEPRRHIECQGALILLLTTDEYNYYYFWEDKKYGPETKVLHVKGTKKDGVYKCLTV